MIDDNQIEHLIMQKMFDRYELFHNADHASDGRVIIDLLSKEKPTQPRSQILFFLTSICPILAAGISWNSLKNCNNR
ncbi:hypothetical protein ACVW0P_004048 [Mucilaginibacter sp. UYNi724]